MNKKLLKTITGIAVAGAALGAAFAYVKKCKEVNDLGEEDFDDLWDDEEEKSEEAETEEEAETGESEETDSEKTTEE